MGQRNVVILRRFQERLELEARHQYYCCAAVESHVQNDDETVDVEERQHADQCVSVGEVTQPFHLPEVCGEVVMREHHAFRQTCGPTRVRKGDQIFACIDLDLFRATVIDEQFVERCRTWQ